MNSIVTFMASPAVRIARIVAGIALIAWGLLGLQGTTGYVVAAIGVLPVLTGSLDVCVIAPLLGAPLSGAKIRAGNN